jgi:hypothetical protein
MAPLLFLKLEYRIGALFVKGSGWQAENARLEQATPDTVK